MELRHLRYFVAVAETGGFTAAAERLHTVQSSLSRQIRDLEDYLGAQLFERNNRQVRLTKVGQLFLDEARLTLAQAERGVLRVREMTRVQSSSLALGFVFGVEAEHLASVVNVLNGAEMEHVELVMHSQSSPSLITKLHDRQLDAAFIRPSRQAQGLQILTLGWEKLILGMPERHPLAGKRRIHLAELVNEPVIGVNRDLAPVLYDAIENLFHRNGIELRRAYQSDNLMMALSLISSVGGMSLLPQSSIRLFPQGVVARELVEESPFLELALAWRADNTSTALSTFIEEFQIVMSR